MTDNELLLAISNMMDKKLDERLKPINDRLDKADITLNTLKFNQGHITEKLKGIEVTMNYNDYHYSRGRNAVLTAKADIFPDCKENLKLL